MKGVAEAVFEEVRQFMCNSPKFEKCIEYGCHALIGLVMEK